MTLSHLLLFLIYCNIALLFAVEHCEYPRKSIIIKQAPSGDTSYSKDNFVIEDSCISSKTLKDGELLLKPLYISVDPYLSSVFRMVPSQTVASSLQISQVIATKSDKFNIGDVVTNALHEVTGPGDMIAGHSEWSTYYIRNDDKLYRIDNVDKNIAIDYYLSSLGLTGATAYYGLLDIGLMKEGENVFISGAAGATGSVVGQIAKNVLNGYVVGTTGNNEKIKWLKQDLNFDDAINYKEFNNSVDEIRKVLSDKFPNGIDIYFDNTGGFVSEAVWPLLNQHGRVVLCGQIANYNRNAPKIDDFLLMMISKEIRAEGFVFASMKPNRWKQFYKDLTEWTKNGKVITKHTVLEGIDKTIDAFLGLFYGSNIGKMVVKIELN